MPIIKQGSPGYLFALLMLESGHSNDSFARKIHMKKTTLTKIRRNQKPINKILARRLLKGLGYEKGSPPWAMFVE